ncbi:acetyltransferase family protein [Clostridium argentinense CDC 2741]|uniref:Acetyltransferase family protein n=1 Tax=Clostridium argentinense CDC 2741 TaxID=1418104 RepID=A0A0C1U4M5_9CLOT|nr:GNAT family N-acetyltransferase [Clostridium argentinense]ARC86466.1 GNAT family N-acetyltransferase [Clostridium argentinense]KIE46563.1 acetyltransferase family protein [Clostridium argentinense CDC 2741]NFF37926.1 GNAT family N-acetyltransferase [Clostridium argentinense]NFP49842.1 GNAT family N-acetyltransferase [Clostridium argentinense]NFP71318.1 GNAT family N-acetyltransferase [Clostridium argentinense]
MSEVLLIDGKKYIYKCNYKDDAKLRNSFNNLTEKTYGFNFEQWYEDGYWGDKYIPYSLLDGDKVVSNVSVSIIDFLILGEQKRYIQIGTVMTDEEYRGQGLCRVLMELALEEWEEKCDLIYLFANDSVLDFYPKFGFEVCNEYQCSIKKTKEDKSEKIRKMSIDNDRDREIIYNMACNTISFSKVSMKNNISLIMFYCTYFMKDNIYYLEDYDTVVICEFNEDILYLQEVLSMKEVKLDNVINAMMNEKTQKVVLGFTPKDISSYEKTLVNEEDTTLFIKIGKDNSFKTGDLMFPVLSHA